MGDFNAKHNEWNPNPRPGRMCISDSHGLWLTQFCNRNGIRVHALTGCTFQNISDIDLFIRNLEMRVSYDGKTGLKHVSVIPRLEVDEPVDIMRRRPA